MAEARDHSPAHDATSSPGGRAYALAWLGLIVLTASSFGAHYLPLGGWATAVALAIAGTKAGIVLIVFMHVLQEPPSIRFIAVLNGVWVAMICLGIAADVATR